MFHPASRKPARASFQPRLECLEERRVLSANLVVGDLVINQSNLNDTAVVTQVTGPLGLHFIRVQETIGGVAQPTRSFFAPFVHHITYKGGAGDDRFDNQTSVPSTAFGGAGNDFLAGGHAADVLYGQDGNDELHGREGNDLMYGGNGDDLMRGGQGNDRMFGGAGKDDIFGALGNDYIDGGRDGVADILRGGLGADTFVSDPVHILFFTFNRDRPQDFNAAEGDRII